MTINELIEDSINDFKRTRQNRLLASERLKKYQNKWDTLNFFFKVSTVIICLLALMTDTSAFKNIATIYSMYIILLQNLLSEKKYGIRSLKLHYEQLEINDLRLELKLLLINSNLSMSDKEAAYKNIFDRYQTSLRNNENHTKLDDRSREEDNEKDWSFDNIFFNINIGLLIIISIIECILWIIN